MQTKLANEKFVANAKPEMVENEKKKLADAESKIKAIEELSYTLGSSTSQTFRKIIVPLSKNTLLLCFFQIFLISWFEYGLTTIIGTGKVKTLTLSVFKFINEANVFYAAFASVLLVIPPMLLVYLNKKMLFFIENSTTS